MSFIFTQFIYYSKSDGLVDKLFQWFRAVFLQFFHRNILATGENKCLTTGSLGALTRPEVATGIKRCFFGHFCFVFKIYAVSYGCGLFLFESSISMILAFTPQFRVKLEETSGVCTMLFQQFEVPLAALGLGSLCIVFICPVTFPGLGA